LVELAIGKAVEEEVSKQVDTAAGAGLATVKVGAAVVVPSEAAIVVIVAIIEDEDAVEGVSTKVVMVGGQEATPTQLRLLQQRVNHESANGST
jgi:hypothetical protein